MRLQVVETGHDADGRARLDLMREARGAEPTDVLRVFCYRPELFGEPFSQLVDDVLRAPSPWTAAERELFATFVAVQNQCPF